MASFEWKKEKEENTDESGVEFEETYDGLGEELEETKDDMNEDTFGMSVEGMGKDFDFSNNTQKMIDRMNHEQILYKNREKILETGKLCNTLTLQDKKKNAFTHLSWNENLHVGSFHQNTKNIHSSMNTQNPTIDLSVPFETNYSNQSTKKHLKGCMSLEEVEAKFFDVNKRKDSQNNIFDMKNLDIALCSQTKVNPKPLRSENQLRGSSRYNFYTDCSSQDVNYSEEQKYKKMNEFFYKNEIPVDMSQYNGLMTASDKNFINRIQLSQLVSNDPYSDDFYYYMYNSLINKDIKRKTLDKINLLDSIQNKQPLNNFKNKHNENPVLKIQQQIQNIVTTGKMKPKATQLSLEGALGKISFSTVRTPRQILSVKKSLDNSTKQGSDIKTYRMNVERNHKFYLYSIEKVYDDLLEIEEICRKQKRRNEDNEQLIDDNDDEDAIKLLKERIWENLQIMEPITKNSDVVHPFISIISYNKGKKLIPRIFEHINSEQKLTILTVIAIYLDHLDVVLYDLYNLSNELRPASMKESIDIFTQVALPSLLACVSEASFQIVISILSIMLERMDFQLITMTKIGLSFLTMFISRAEIIKQSGQADENDLKQWRNIYDLMFSKLVGRFIYVFPSSLSFSDEIYPWQFMAACAISSTIEQQHILVTEVREKVLDNVISSKHLPPDIAAIKLGNVNLFLHALGLDIEQLDI
ncbi:hypothetical protein PCANB_001565 [Pneumocystis canis]|nr:hypothetical protein PCK1_001559 [Pneumocystis canis]KAG5439266.1 hypothetical protein PCANB_001565 [Pneumocystis canis]